MGSWFTDIDVTAMGGGLL